jgi:hypothetical protein
MSTQTNEDPSIVSYNKNFEIIVGLENSLNNNGFFIDETIYSALAYSLYYDNEIKKDSLKISTLNFEFL